MFFEHFGKIYFFSKLLSESHVFIFRENGQESQKNVFDQNFDEKSFLRAKFNFSKPPRTLKLKKINTQQ
tara:strand:+ start:2409 stop:2615 length:207 start_codon:yes stop_codon:yes gene_type:complete